jgi:hypothetical protein
MKVSVTASLGLALILGLHGVGAAAQSGAAKVDNSVPDIKFDAGNDDVDADNYLNTMRGLLERYNNTVRAVVLGGKKDGSPAAAAQATTLAKDIRAVRAPKRVAREHAQLSDSLALIQNFESLGGQESQGISGLNALAAELRVTINKYKAAVAALSHMVPAGDSPLLHTQTSGLSPAGAGRVRRSGRSPDGTMPDGGDDTAFGGMPGPESAEALDAANSMSDASAPNQMAGSTPTDMSGFSPTDTTGSNPMSQLLNSLFQGMGMQGMPGMPGTGTADTGMPATGMPATGMPGTGMPSTGMQGFPGMGMPGTADVNSPTGEMPEYSGGSAAMPNENTSGLGDGR